MCPAGARMPPGATGSLPQPVARLVAGLQKLPPLQDVADTPLLPGPWCWDVPLWGNPMLPGNRVGGRVLGLEAAFPDLATLGTIRTLGDVITAEADVTSALTLVGRWYYQQVWWLGWFAGHADFSNRHTAVSRLREVLQRVPTPWLSAAQAQLLARRPAGIIPAAQDALAVHVQRSSDPAAALAVHQQLYARLGWKLPDGLVVHLATLTVRQATQLQMITILEQRRDKHAAFLSDAVGAPLTPANRTPLLRQLAVCFKDYWKLKWDNSKKEVFWRLTLNGLPTLARMAMVSQPCQCGVVGPGRRHCYWECPVAVAVRGTIADQLQQPDGLTCSRLWLGDPPDGVHAGVWQVVCLSALNAMDAGRRCLAKVRVTGSSTSVQSQVLVASRCAVATFWSEVADFAGLGLFPVAWLQALMALPGHPFLSWAPPLQCSTLLVVRRPTAAQAVAS